MVVTCDICNGILIVESGGGYAICENCGMKHSIERVREKLALSDVNAEKTIPLQPQADVKQGPRPALKMSANFIKTPDIDNTVQKDEVFDASFSVVSEDSLYYTRQYSENELAVLEGRVGNYKSYVDTRDYFQLQRDIKSYFSDSLFDSYTIEENVPPQMFGAHPRCMSIDFLFKKDGKPVLAVAILRSPARKHGAVTGTINACKSCGIKYIDFVVGMPNTKFYVLRKTLTNII